MGLPPAVETDPCMLYLVGIPPGERLIVRIIHIVQAAVEKGIEVENRLEFLLLCAIAAVDIAEVVGSEDVTFLTMLA